VKMKREAINCLLPYRTSLWLTSRTPATSIAALALPGRYSCHDNGLA